MKKCFSFVTAVCFFSVGWSQQWSAGQLQKANTFFDEYRLSDTEKQVLQYINLCRLYPDSFITIELNRYTGIPGMEDKNFGTFKNSLIKDLTVRKSCGTLQPDDLLYDDAKCYGDELAKNKLQPHQRLRCISRNYGECIYYGSGEARHIAMQWLIDSGVESLAHRKMCLLPAYRKAGIKVNPHFEYPFCAVLELSK